MNGSRKIISHLQNLRRNRGAKFLFLPKKMNLKDISLAIFFEYFDISKSDDLIIGYVLRELFEIGLLQKNPLEYYSYSCGGVTFHDVYLWTSDGGRFCRGTSVYLSEAYAKAVGEVFERTALRYPVTQEIVINTQENLLNTKTKYVSSKDFPQPIEDQIKTFANFKILDTDPFSWIKVTSLSNREKLLIPAQTVFYNNSSVYNFEKSIIQPSTHGAGAGYLISDAFRSGICEIMHRHFFLRSWYLNIPKIRIDINSIPKHLSIYQLISNLMDNGFFVTLLDYSKEAKIPTIICILEKNGGWFMGGSTSFTLAGAIERSISEAMATYLWQTQTTITKKNFINEDFIKGEGVIGFLDRNYTEAFSRVMLYASQGFISKLNLNILNEKTTPFSYENDKVSGYNIVEHAIKIFGNIYSYESNKKFLKDYEYSVVKMIIPTSYFFALDEVYSRPVLNGVAPKNMLINPFP